ncbi:winged helix-turn-helix transcriptional regulator [Janthinobacterium sp. Mn2066]|uniref:winged helix-turn-helix transcriptional regulator n=1 Tax=Janthinobacterium sp. Mn2066 TaxID=3395264 RepID=UPI003BC64F5A
MKRKSLQGNLCAIARSLDAIGDWWSLLIIRDAAAGIGRFSEFQRSLGIPKNILSSRLKTMTEQGILEVVPASDGSAYQEYILTQKGVALLPVLVALGQWGADHLFEPKEMGSIPLDARKKRPLKKLEMWSEDGRLLQPEDVLLPRIVSMN